jgi:3-oxoacyl-[acyl-carrier-protein] synthase II
VPDLSTLEFPGRKSVWALSRSITMGFAAAKFALEDAGIAIADANRSEMGVVYGTTLAGLGPLTRFDQQALREGPRLADPLMFPSTGASAPGCQVSIMLGIDGFNTTLSNGQTSGLDAIHYARQFIRMGRAQMVMAGAVEEICLESFLACCHRGLLAGATNGSCECCRPFDSRRNGALAGEGSAVLVLEDWEHARNRGAHVYAEVSGYGACFDASPQGTSGPDAALGSMAAALRDAGLSPSDVDAVFASANGSVAGDRFEAQALRRLFTAAHLPPVTAVKSNARRILQRSRAVAGRCRGSGLAAPGRAANGELPVPRSRGAIAPSRPRL